MAFKTTASESLALAPWLKYFFDAASSGRGVPDFAVHARCFGQLVDIIETVFESHRVPVDTAALQRAVDAYLGEFERLYGEGPMTPKFHYAIASPVLPSAPVSPSCSSDDADDDDDDRDDDRDDDHDDDADDDDDGRCRPEVSGGAHRERVHRHGCVHCH